MSVINITKGKNIKLKGAAEKGIMEAPLPLQAAVQPPDFRGINLRILVKEGENVKVGTPIFEDKTIPEIKIVSPGSGKVASINRGAKRALLSYVIDLDGKQEATLLGHFTKGELNNCSSNEVIKLLLQGGVWPAIRQRPFSKIANPKDKPKSIFIHAMNTEPLAMDTDFILQEKEEEFQAGLDAITKLTDGDVHLCFSSSAESNALTKAKNVKKHQFSGPHPSGNVSTHIHHVDPIHKGEIVWYIEAEDVLRIAHLLLKGQFSAEKYVAVTGEMAQDRVYKKTIIGAPLKFLAKTDQTDGIRFISGGVLAGRNVSSEGFVGYYDTQISLIPEGGNRELLGWLAPGTNKYTFSKTFLSAFLPEKEASLDTDEHGGHRAIILNNIYDDYVAIDVMTFFLLRAIIAGEIDEAEKLGILECDEEDFALCTFACPSKMDVGQVIRDGLDLIEKEG